MQWPGPTKITKKTRNNHQTPYENNGQHLKIRVPAGSNAYLCICVFSKEMVGNITDIFETDGEILLTLLLMMFDALDMMVGNITDITYPFLSWEEID